MRHQLIVMALSLTCSGCDYVVLSTSVGEHVVYHWDASEEQLCGGTVSIADRFLAGIPDHYGVPRSTGGPRVEYFWDLPGALAACSRGRRGPCGRWGPAGYMLFTTKPLHTHELAHTARGGHNLPFFINEAFAARWQSELIDSSAWRTEPNFLSVTDLRSQLEVSKSSDVNYAMAHTWWVALEVTYGPGKMGEFIIDLEGSGSADDVEAALQRVFGITLAESAALAEGLPEILLDDPACLLTGIPTFEWTGEPLVVDRGDSVMCAEDDIVNHAGSRSAWLFALEFPAGGVEVSISVSVTNDADPHRSELALTWCDGEPSEHDHMTTYSFAATETEGRVIYLSGRLVAALRGVRASDGSVELPKVVFEETSP